MRRTEQLSRSLVLVAAAVLAAVGIAAIAAIVAVVPSSEETSARDHASVLDLSKASPDVRQAYQLALARRDLFSHLPCYCGCVLLDEPHRSELLGYLRSRRYAYVIPDMIQQAYLPPSDVEVTAPWSVVRFHGRNPAMLERRAPTNRVYDYTYSEEELRPWVETVKDLTHQVERVYLLFNNHYRGQSARNAREIVSMLAE